MPKHCNGNPKAEILMLTRSNVWSTCGVALNPPKLYPPGAGSGVPVDLGKLLEAANPKIKSHHPPSQA